MQNRLPFVDEFLDRYKSIFLMEAVNQDDWVYLFQRFRNIIPEDNETDWRLELDRFTLNDDIIEEAKGFKNNFLAMWNHFKPSYPLISKLAISLLTISHSSVPVERVFSWLKDTKNPKRNRLTLENLEASLLTKQKFLDSGKWVITEDMIQRRKTMRREQKTSDNLQRNESQSQFPLLEQPQDERDLGEEEELSMMLEEMNMMVPSETQNSNLRLFEESNPYRHGKLLSEIEPLNSNKDLPDDMEEEEMDFDDEEIPSTIIVGKTKRKSFPQKKIRRTKTDPKVKTKK